MDGIIYSPKENLPLFKLICDADGIRSAEYLNIRTKCTEQIRVSRLVVYLLEAELTGDDLTGMIFSPERRIPLGVIGRYSGGGYYIEVKYKHNKEKIHFSTYVSLLLESKAMRSR